MSDLIERQKAIDAIEEMQMPIMRSEFSGDQFIFTGMSRALQAIMGLPSAQPEILACGHGELVQDGSRLVRDCISRQQAIDAFERRQVYHSDTIADILSDLPSAQPEREVYSNMSNKEFEKWLYEHGICHPDINESISCKVVPLLIDSAINELPSAQPERKTGRWVYDEERCATGIYAICTACDEVIYQTGDLHYCPNCGAKMEVEP